MLTRWYEQIIKFDKASENSKVQDEDDRNLEVLTPLFRFLDDFAAKHGLRG